MKKTTKFLSAVTKHQKKQSIEKFQGFLKDYLEILETDETTASLAHRRLYQTITRHGITRLDQSEARCRRIFNAESRRV